MFSFCTLPCTCYRVEIIMANTLGHSSCDIYHVLFFNISFLVFTTNEVVTFTILFINRGEMRFREVK